MGEKTEPEIKVYKASGYSSRSLAETGSENYRYTIGFITTPHGVVGVYTQADHTSAVIVLSGLEHRAWWKRSFSERGLITVCRRFAAARFAASDTSERPPSPRETKQND
jgi:hypothetical protein